MEREGEKERERERERDRDFSFNATYPKRLDLYKIISFYLSCNFKVYLRST